MYCESYVNKVSLSLESLDDETVAGVIMKEVILSEIKPLNVSALISDLFAY